MSWIKRETGERRNLWLALSAAAWLLAACDQPKANPAAEAPPAAQVVRAGDENLMTVDNPEQFLLTTAVAHQSSSQLVVTGVVAPDILRTVPVISIATGRVVDIKARLGDTVKKGQLLMRVQSADIAAAYSDYRKAIADEKLANIQLERSKLLFDRGAISLNDLQTAEDVENKAVVDVETSAEHLRVLGSPLDHPSALVDIYAPVSGVITDQQVTNAAAVQGLGAPANPFTISDLSFVWVLCDVYENDLPDVHLGETADIRLTAYPNQVFTGTISNVGSVLDPTIRTAKVRIELKNPGMMKVGMFVSATFHGRKAETHAIVPTTAVLHLHDHEWVYVPEGDKKFRRLEVTVGEGVPGNMQEILSGIKPGDKVIANALIFQNTVEQ